MEPNVGMNNTCIKQVIIVYKITLNVFQCWNLKKKCPKEMLIFFVYIL